MSFQGDISIELRQKISKKLTRDNGKVIIGFYSTAFLVKNHFLFQILSFIKLKRRTYMVVSTFFCSRATEASLKPLENIICSLKREARVKKVTRTSYSGHRRENVCTDYLDKEIDEKVASPISGLAHENETTSLYSEVSYPVVQLDPSIKWGELPVKLENLYRYLSKNKESYYSSYVFGIAQKSHIMVVKIEAYLKKKKTQVH